MYCISSCVSIISLADYMKLIVITRKSMSFKLMYKRSYCSIWIQCRCIWWNIIRSDCSPVCWSWLEVRISPSRCWDYPLTFCDGSLLRLEWLSWFYAKACKWINSRGISYLQPLLWLLKKENDNIEPYNEIIIIFFCLQYACATLKRFAN
jgi:hypothetical protein